MVENTVNPEKSVNGKQQDLADLIRQEVARALKAAQSGKEGSSNVNFVHTMDYAGMENSQKNEGFKNSLIIDTGASNHICVNHELCDALTTLKSPIFVYLPNGTTTLVTQVADIYFNGFKLANTLFIPNFTHNLLSVQKLTITNSISCVFFPKFCLMQDLKSEKVLAMGKVVGDLYYLDHDSFSKNVITTFNNPVFLEQYISDNFFLIPIFK